MDSSCIDPHRDCSICPRLSDFILEQRRQHPSWHNAPVDTWVTDRGDDAVKLLIVGLAPGLQGANRTGRPFTGDYAGDLLYETLLTHNLAKGTYAKHRDDGFELEYCAITNAVRCVPPQNKPVAEEINNCRPFLTATIRRFKSLKAILTLGKISHDSTVRAFGERPSQLPFGHSKRYQIDDITLISSYHCSRYNTNTGRLTEEMFDGVMALAKSTF